MDAHDQKLARPAATASRRRRIARLAVALTAATALLSMPTTAAATNEQARTAGSFVDSIGVNIHSSYSDTPYGERFDAVKAKLADLGVRHVRDGLEPERPDQYDALNELAATGIKSTLILGEPAIGSAGLAELIATLKANVRDAAEAIEGPNEIDMWGDASELPHLAGYQQDLHAAVKGDPSLAGLPVIGPSLVQPRNQEALGDISGQLDFGNIHSYPNGLSPEGNLSNHLDRAARNSGSKPVMATETGYNTASGETGELDPVSERAMAVYMPRLYLEYFRRGVARTFAYELLDEGTGGSDPEDNFGLLRNDLSEKPAFAALRNTIDILDDSGPAFAPATVAYTLGGDTGDLHHLLLQKSDGTFYLALWRAEDVWDPASRRDLEAPEGRVTLELGRQAVGAEAYLPTTSSSPAYTLPASSDRPLGVKVGAQVTIVRFTLGDKTTAGRIRLWVSKRSVPAGGRIAVKGRLPAQATGRSLPVKIQRRQPGWRTWRTVGHGRTSQRGVFRRTLRISKLRNGRVSRFRVVASQAKPSRAIRVRVR